MAYENKRSEKQAIKQASAEYNEAMKLLNKLCEIRFASNYKQKFEEMSICFEEMLQGIIIITAIQDGVACKEELAFFKSFTEHTNILEFLTDELFKYTSNWQNLTLRKFKTIDDQTKEALNKILRAILVRSSEKLYQSFAEVDYNISEVDYLHEFKLRIRNILCILCEIDGDEFGSENFNEEASAGLRAFYDIIEKYWKSYSEQDKLWRSAMNSAHEREWNARFEDIEG